MLSLKNKIVVITGGSGKLASFLIKPLLACNTKVLLIGRNTERLNALIEKYSNENLECFQCDLTNEESVEELVGNINKKYKKIDIIINCVGAWYAGEVEEESSYNMQELLNSNVLSIGIFYKHTKLVLAKSSFGQILNVISVAANEPSHKWMLYSAAKAAVKNLSQSVRQESQSSKLRVMDIYPSAMSMTKNEWAMSYMETVNSILFMLMQPKDVVIENLKISKLR